MAALLSGYISLERLEEILKVVKSKNEKGFKFTASINDESNEYGQNVGFFAEQTKEQREAKTKKYYFGNGNVFWTDDKIVKGAKKEAAQPTTAQEPDLNLPF